MKCHEMNDLMDQYLDNTLSDEEKHQFEEHLATCEDCKASVDMLKMMNDALHDIPMVDLPEGFGEELHQKLVDEQAKEEKQAKIVPIKKFYRQPWFKAMGSVAALLVIALVVGPMLSNSPMNDFNNQESKMLYGGVEESADMAPVMDAPAEAPSVMFNESTAEVAKNAVASPSVRGLDDVNESNFVVVTGAEVESEPQLAETNRKIIRSANMSVETTEYDMYLGNLNSIVNSVGGYIANQNSGFNRYYFEESEDNLRYMNITIRIPEGNFESVLESVGEFGVVRSKNVNADDITNAYRDTEAEIANLKITEERLRDILKSAEKTEDVLEIERELTRIRGQINNYTQTLVQWDRLVSLSTISIYVSEVDAYEGDIKPIDPTLGQRMQDAFNNSITAIVEGGEKLLINIVGFTPYLPFWIVLVIVGVLVYRFVRKRGK